MRESRGDADREAFTGGRGTWNGASRRFRDIEVLSVGECTLVKVRISVRTGEPTMAFQPNAAALW